LRMVGRKLVRDHSLPQNTLQEIPPTRPRFRTNVRKSRVRGAVVGHIAVGAAAPSSILISGILGRSVRITVGTSVFLLGVLAGAAVAAGDAAGVAARNQVAARHLPVKLENGCTVPSEVARVAENPTRPRGTCSCENLPSWREVAANITRVFRPLNDFRTEPKVTTRYNRSPR
jgi:hypothetical protein